MARVERAPLRRAIERRLRTDPVVMLVGPRQCGKTTIAREVAASRRSTIFDLEAPADRNRLRAPMAALEPLRGLVVLDEAQLEPGLFPILRVLADRKPLPARFLLLGSASPDLVRGVSESLAGRVAMLPMGGFDLEEAGAGSLRSLWWRGGFPRSFLARTDADSRAWRDDFIQTFLERDLARLGVAVPAPTMRRFWLMVAHCHGQILNASELGRSLAQAHTTVRHHLDILCGALVMRILPPWFENIGKRQVRSPKVYVRDSGLLHALLGIDSFAALEGHPKAGSSWEGFVIEEILRATGDREAFFWNTQGGAEIDLLVFTSGKRHAFECKYVDAPEVTRSLHVARQDLGLARAFVVHPGRDSYPLNDWCEAIAIGDLRRTVYRLLRGRGR
jgi:predicted AAA+ superfamily ATPase